jgi:hypothetical protein
MKQEITQKALKELLSYDKDSGVFIWKSRPQSHFKCNARFRAWHTRCCGKLAGTICHYGYRAIKIRGHMYKAHRLVWLYIHGGWPSGEIDHINHNRLDNSLRNLRQVSPMDNSKNLPKRCDNSSGIIGVYWDKARGLWSSYINHERKRLALGRSADFFEACCTRKSAEVRYGFHPNHGLSHG